jgi:hypothetical protein
MRNLDTLKRDARIAYERGRFWAAARVALVVVPVTILCAYETRSLLRTTVLGLILLTLTASLRWRQHHGFSVVSTGLRSGALPLAAALGLCRFAPSCPPDVAFALCSSAGLLAGTVAGRSLSSIDSIEMRWLQRLSAAAVAAMTAALGCLAFGLGIATGAGVAVALGVAITTSVSRRAPA